MDLVYRLLPEMVGGLVIPGGFGQAIGFGHMVELGLTLGRAGIGLLFAGIGPASALLPGCCGCATSKRKGPDR